MPVEQQQHDFSPYSVAELYRKAGWLGTIPIPYHEKHPPPRGFTGAAALYPDDKQVVIWQKDSRSNIALRLAETSFLPEASPYQTNAYELLGIDVDDYADKAGYEQLQTLESELGKLAPTVCSSSRWEQSPHSGVRVYLVPAVLRFLGKAAPAIDIIQKAHRYMLVWPSLNPDVPYAESSTYRFKRPDGAYYEHRSQAGTIDALAAAIPPLSDVTVLPEAWLDYLSCNRMLATEHEVSSLGGGELLEWANQTFNDSHGEMCRMMSNAVEKKLAELLECISHHDLLTKAHWQILRLGAEGHSGWIVAMQNFNNKWFKKTLKDRDADGPEVLMAEIQRSVMGTLSKIEPSVGKYIPEDECAVGNVTSLHDVDHWGVKLDEEDISTSDGDFDILGPVISHMPRCPAHNSDQYEQTDTGNARHFIDLFGDNIKFVESRQSWVLWNGLQWYRDIDEKLANRAFSIVQARQMIHAKKLPRGDQVQMKIANSWQRWALRSGNSQPILNALRQSRTLFYQGEPVATLGTEFDSNPAMLGCENGILILDRDPYIRPAKKEDYVTFNTHTTYIPWDTEAADECGVLEGYKLWQEYLDIFLPDIKVRHFIQKVMGHLLVGENPEKLLIFVYGPHDTGKSTMLSGIRSALGDYYGTIDINLFSNQKLNPGLIRAVPLRVAGMSEVDHGNMDASIIKRLTGNDTVTAEAKFSNEIFEGRPQFTTLIACNQEPKIKNVDEALQERIMVLPFDFQIPMEDRNYSRQSDIEKTCSEAVLSWLVDGYKMYCRQGLKRSEWPIEVQALCGNVVGNLNPTQRFISECIEKNTPEALEARRKATQKAHLRRKSVPTVSDWELDWTPAADAVYELYQRWCASNGERNVISKTDLMREMGVPRSETRNVKGTNYRCYVGIRLRTGVDE